MSASRAAKPAPKQGLEAGGREITPEELAQWRRTGVWPDGVSEADFVELTPDEVLAMGETGSWPERLG